MYQLLVIIIFTVFSGAIFATTNNKINDSRSCFRGPFESHEKWLGFLSSRKKNFNTVSFLTYFPEEKFKQRKSNLECVDFTYQVDGLTVEGYYLKPKNSENKKLPVVIFNRGGNAKFGYIYFGSKMNFISDVAMGGYVVVGSQYRGSSSHLAKNGQDEFGGADINDVLALRDLLQEIPNADTSNIALVGWSRGVMQSYMAAKKMPNVKAIISIAGNADAEKALEWRPSMEKVYEKRIPDFNQNRSVELAKRSVIRWLDELPNSSPVLLLHGTADKRVNVEQSKMLANAMLKKTHPHKLIIYQDDNHGIHKNRADLIKQVHQWLATYLD